MQLACALPAGTAQKRRFCSHRSAAMPQKQTHISADI